MVNTKPEAPAPEQQGYPVNTIGWLAAQLDLEVSEAIALARQSHKSLPLTADATTLLPVEKVDRLLATKEGRDNVLKLNGAPQTTGKTSQEQGGAIATERRLLTLSEIKTVAQMAGVTQKLARSVDAACFQREEELHALRGFSREQRLIEAENTGRLVARLQYSDDLNDALDEMEIELAQNASRASDLSLRVFGLNLQEVIDNQAEADIDRAEARQQMSQNFKKVQQGEADSLGEDTLIDPWETAKHRSSGLGVKRISRLRKAVTS